MQKGDLERRLEIWGFDLNSVDIDKIEYVPMNEFRVSSKEKTLLFVDNLQICIAIYAYCKNFAFATHINTKIDLEKNFELSNDGKPIKCNKIQNLYNEILKYNEKYSYPIMIGVSFGCAPLSKDYPTVVLIYKELSNLIKFLNNNGIVATQLDDIYEMNFIIDSTNSKLITPNNKISSLKMH